jgi:hypothetical protein
VLFNQLDGDESDWMKELFEVVTRFGLPNRQTPRTLPWREALEAQFGELQTEEGRHEQTADREQLIALLASFSWIGGLPPDRRTAALAASREVLERRGVDAVTTAYRTEMTIAQKRAADSRASAG